MAMKTSEGVIEGIRWVTTGIVALWGQMPQLTQLLVALMIVDITLGLAVAIKRRDVSSKAAWNGMTKKIGSLLLVAVAALLNPFANNIMEINLVQAASAFYVVPELLSISRNAGILGVPVFTQFSLLMRYFQTVSGQGSEDETTHSKKTIEPARRD